MPEEHPVRSTCHCSQCDFYFRVWANRLISHEPFEEIIDGDTQPTADSPPPSQAASQCPTEDLTVIDEEVFVEVLAELGTVVLLPTQHAHED